MLDKRAPATPSGGMTDLQRRIAANTPDPGETPAARNHRENTLISYKRSGINSKYDAAIRDLNSLYDLEIGEAMTEARTKYAQDTNPDVPWDQRVYDVGQRFIRRRRSEIDQKRIEAIAELNGDRARELKFVMAGYTPVAPYELPGIAFEVP